MKILPIIAMLGMMLDCMSNALSDTPHIFTTGWSWVWWIAFVGWGNGIFEYVRDSK